MATCKNCGKEFAKEMNRQVYCSPACRMEHRRKNRTKGFKKAKIIISKEPKISKTCVDCGCSFLGYNYRIRCDSCAEKIRKRTEELKNRPIITRNCIVCGKSYSTKNLRKLTCSDECSLENNHLLNERKRAKDRLPIEPSKCLWCHKKLERGHKFCGYEHASSYKAIEQRIYRLFDGEQEKRELKKLERLGKSYKLPLKYRPETLEAMARRLGIKITEPKEVMKEEPKTEDEPKITITDDDFFADDDAYLDSVEEREEENPEEDFDYSGEENEEEIEAEV